MKKLKKFWNLVNSEKIAKALLVSWVISVILYIPFYLLLCYVGEALGATMYEVVLIYQVVFFTLFFAYGICHALLLLFCSIKWSAGFTKNPNKIKWTLLFLLSCFFIVFFVAFSMLAILGGS